MPFYEFECTCGEITEELVKMGTEEIECPKCGAKAKKIISRCSFSLKGGGWYADGYASTKKGGCTTSSTKSSSSPCSSKSSTSSSKTDS